MTTPNDILRAKLNLETAQLQWSELERHFARGDVIKVPPAWTWSTPPSMSPR